MKVGQRIFDSTQQIYPRRLSSGNQAFNTFMTEVPIILSCRNQSIDLQRKSIDWFLRDKDLPQERIKPFQ